MKLLKNSTIVALEGTMDSFTGGVFASDNQFVEGSLLERGRPGQIQNAVEYLDGTYIYGGCLFGHFGHFIWESLSRLYTIRQCKEYPILFISPNEKIFNIHKLFFKTICVRNELCLIKKTTRVKNLIYSCPGSSINPLNISDEQLHAMKCLEFPKNTNRKVWLSRSKLKSGKIINEVAIEKELQKIGYEIVHPECLPLREQVRLVSTSDIVAGFDGSQFFTFLFSKEIGAKFFVFNRRKGIPQTIPYALGRRNIEFQLCHFDLEYIDGQSASSNFYHPHPDKVIDILSRVS